MSWGFNLEEEKKEYPVSGTVTISCEEYRDLIGSLYELKAKAQKEHDDWYEEYQKGCKKDNEIKELKEKHDDFLKKISLYYAFVNSDDEVNAKYKDFVAKKKLEELEEEEEE